MKSKVLLATTCRWYSAARLALTFERSGCVVDAVCPPRHPIVFTGAYRDLYPYHGLSPIVSMRSAIEKSTPDIVVPCDDLATLHLHQLHRQESRNGSGTVVELLERSLGDPCQFSLIEARSQLIALARKLGIDAPETDVVSNLVELRGWIARFGLPAVLKTDGTSGGLGVLIVRSEAEAEAAFGRLQTPPNGLRTFKRAIVDHDRTLIAPWLQRRLPVINIQSFSAGIDANIAVACWEGKVLASISAKVVRTRKKGGPASVVELIENSDMKLAAEKLAGHLKLSGVCGFDFLLDESTDRAHLIEMNPRATQTCHLALGTHRNLPAALAAALRREPVQDSVAVSHKNTIALFPLEWQNDPDSEYIRSGYHDVPWEAPRLVKDCVDARMRNGGWLTYDNLNRLRARLPWNRP
jgi:hypothetical protein